MMVESLVFGASAAYNILHDATSIRHISRSYLELLRR